MTRTTQQWSFTCCRAGDKFSLSFARIENHYFVNGEENKQKRELDFREWQREYARMQAGSLNLMTSCYATSTRSVTSPV
jgi:hypothetical protein